MKDPLNVWLIADLREKRGRNVLHRNRTREVRLET